jgi:hypothetical protein
VQPKFHARDIEMRQHASKNLDIELPPTDVSEKNNGILTPFLI